MLGALEFRDARPDDLPAIVAMLRDDELGRDRESGDVGAARVALTAITADQRHRQVVGEIDGAVVATLQLTLLPCLTHDATARAQVEGVRVAGGHRGHGIGEAMVRWAIAEARARGCGVVQLTTDRRRPDARRFYERLGFEATHDGMKLRLDAASPDPTAGAAPAWPVSMKGVLGWDGRVVLLANARGEWELPGGRLDPDDATPAAALRREIAEELGLDVEVGDPIDTWIYEPRPGRRVVIITHRIHLPDGTVPPITLQVSDEHTAGALFDRGQLDGIALPHGYRDSIERSGVLDAR